MEQERLEILRMLERGQIDAAEAFSLLSAYGMAEAEMPMAAEELPEYPEDKWSRSWIYLLMVGGGAIVLGSLVMGLVYATGTARGWLLCGWLPMILGVMIMLLAWWSRTATWLRLRISEGDKKISLGFPIPLTLAAWGLQIAGPFVPQLQETGLDDLLIALRDGRAREEPIVIDVQDKQDGELVQICNG